jgi:hypothetical protein
MPDEKHFPADHRGLEDAVDFVPAKPCARRMNTTPVSWCGLPDGHEAPCHAEPVKPIEVDDLGPGAAKRRR